jgi:type II secretory pathway component PulM
MAAAVERAKDWWEGKAPRERRFLAALGATLVICVLAWGAINIRSGLNAIEKRNQEARDALAAIDRHRVTMATQAAQKPAVTIPDTQLALDAYLNPIITELGLPEPTYPGVKDTQKGAYTERAITVKLKGLNIDQLKDLLEKIETKNPAVAITEIKIKKNSFGDPEKNLEVDLTVITFSKQKSGGAGAGSGAGGAGAGAGAGAGKATTGAGGSGSGASSSGAGGGVK